jgi:hypothetical protein
MALVSADVDFDVIVFHTLFTELHIITLDLIQYQLETVNSI